MPREVYSREEFRRIAERAEECRVKESIRVVRTESGVERKRIVKLKARTRSYLYTIVFENYDEGIEFAKSLKDVCKNMVILDSSLEGKI